MDEKVILINAIQAVNSNQIAYCKFLSANDTGETGGHQSGIYIAKNSYRILFNEQGNKGENKDRNVFIKWQDDFETNSRFTYYGKNTRDEYRITRFNHGFPFLKPDHTGDLFVLVKTSEDYYLGYIFSTESDIDEFLESFAMSPSDTGQIIEKKEIKTDTDLLKGIQAFIDTKKYTDFPNSIEMAKNAQSLYYEIRNHKERIFTDPDSEIISWTKVEYQLFRMIEGRIYASLIGEGFKTVDDFIEKANMVLNRRKSRAGKSLEHHLSTIFDENTLRYAFHPKTEGNKHPDFIFPGMEEYFNRSYPENKLIFLGAKTTCKDRWRQILNEADRIQTKYLFTLQQGISTHQINEMEIENVQLVVPKPYIKAFPKEKQGNIWTLKKFVEFSLEKLED